MATDELGWSLLDAAVDNDLDLAEELIETGADVDCVTDDGWTPLIEAAAHFDGAMTRLLLDHGADPNRKTEVGYTALQRAAGQGNVEVVRLLLDADADVTACDDDGQTAYDMAQREFQAETASMIARKQNELSRAAGNNRMMLEGTFAVVMMMAPRSSKPYHLVCVEFEDGTKLRDQKVYGKSELELPPERLGKKIKSLSVNMHQP